MNHNIESMKNAMQAYRAKVAEADARVNSTRRDYGDEAAQREAIRQQTALDAARLEAQRAIRAAYEAGTSEVKRWGTLNGDNLTADAKLLDAGLVDASRFEDMKAKYADNYTMLEALRKYGDARNDEHMQKARDAGRNLEIGGPYNTRDIPTVEGKIATWDKIRDSAMTMLDMIDGRTGDRWARALHESTGFTSIDHFADGMDV